MKFLIDNNLSYKIIGSLDESFLGSVHVRGLGLSQASDIEIWEYAKNNGFTILTQDSDFIDLIAVKGIPPKCVYISLGNSQTMKIISLLNLQKHKIREFVSHETDQYLIIEH